jgi:hypothetical protein
MGFNPPFLAIDTNSDQMQIKRPTPKHRNKNVAHDAVHSTWLSVEKLVLSIFIAEPGATEKSP